MITIRPRPSRRATRVAFGEAVTSKWQTFTGTDVLIAYLRLTPDMLCGIQGELHQCSIYETANGNICFKRSTDNGYSFGAETCTGDKTATYGLTATWDIWSGRYVIAWVDNNWQIKLRTVLTDGTLGPVTSLNVSSPHAPSMACAGGFTGECVLAYQSADSAGTLRWLKVHVDPNTGSVIVDSSWGQGYLIYDTPSVMVDVDANVYRLAFAQTGSAIYSYKMTIQTGTSWTGTGDIWNNTSTHISSPALAGRTTTWGPWTKPYAWFVRYW